MITFRDTFKKLLPSWLTTGDGEKVLYVQSLIQDMFLYRAYLGALCGFPSRTPDDGLGKIGQDRLITRGISESRESYVYRLKHYIPALQRMATAFETIRQVRAYINSPVRVRVVDARGNWYTIDADGTKTFQPYLQNWNWDDTPANVGRLWVIIYSENGPWLRHTYGDGHKYGDAGFAWGGTFTPEVAADLVRLATDWTAQGIMVEHIIVTFDDTLFNPADVGTLPDGAWGKPYKYVGGVAVPSRFTGASYIEVKA